MMKYMAYKGKGFGKNEQGILTPIESSKQKGRRGLGYELKDLEQAIKSFKPEDEVIEIKEEIKWVYYEKNETYSFDDLCDWIKFGNYLYFKLLFIFNFLFKVFHSLIVILD